MDWIAQINEPSPITRSGDYILLHFGDGREIFAQCLPKRSQGGVKIQKRTYDTYNLIGLAYGTVLEVHRNQGLLLPVVRSHRKKKNQTHGVENGVDNGVENGDEEEEEEEVKPEENEDEDSLQPKEEEEEEEDDLSFLSAHWNPIDCNGLEDEKSDNNHIHNKNHNNKNSNDLLDQNADNRHLLDTNTSQNLSQQDLERMRMDSNITGRDIVHALLHNSSTYQQKTSFSKAKYIKRKLLKYQQRCRIVRCTAATICQAMFKKDARKISNLRQDTLALILSFSNVSAGSKVMILDHPGTMGILTGALAQRLGGYGLILSIYVGQQPSCGDLLARFNLSFGEQSTIHWLHAGEVFQEDSHHVAAATATSTKEDSSPDYEKIDRESLVWPCPLQTHTKLYLESMSTDKERIEFLDKRCARFARKLTRPSIREVGQIAKDTQRPCDSLILATKYNPTSTLLSLLPYLAPSCPFVVYYEFIEPLLHCFREIQRLGLAINLRLCDTWMREYQILPGRTHPNMNMSQNGGFILTGIKLDPIHGKNELEEDLLKDIRASAKVSRRGVRKPQVSSDPSEEYPMNQNNSMEEECPPDENHERRTTQSTNKKRKVEA